MIIVYQGLPGAGKSMMMARTLVDVLYRNRAWEKKTGVRRQVYHNLMLSEALREEFKDFLVGWDSPDQLSRLRNVDVFWDEIATHLDATQWQNMSLELKRWLQQHRKFGIEIYGTCQNFAQIDVSFRRLTEYLLDLKKYIGSRDISATKPPPKWIWGLIGRHELDPMKFDKETEKFSGSIWPKFFWLTRKDVEIYDTTAEVPVGRLPELRHSERRCGSCGHVKVTHL